MDHDATREQLELAALEPGGLDRLMAGDTATAQAVASHLAGCASCSDELVRLSIASTVIRTVVRELPSPDPRERTLAVVRATGVSRRATAMAPRVPAAAEAPVAAVRRGRLVLGWVGVIAATVALSVLTTSFIVGARVDTQLAAQAKTVEALEEVTTATLAITAMADAEHVALVGTTDRTLDGNLVFSPSTTELVVVATGLTPPPAGKEYRCWVQTGGARRRVGKMFFSADLAYWIGPAPAVSGLAGAATFGVSLVEVTGQGVDADPVLLGRL